MLMMSNFGLNQYMPNYAIHPGEILEETLEARGIPKGDFARRCGISAKTVSQIISGNAPVLPETALCFERVLGVSSTIWNSLNAQYDNLNQLKKKFELVESRQENRR